MIKGLIVIGAIVGCALVIFWAVVTVDKDKVVNDDE